MYNRDNYGLWPGEIITPAIFCAKLTCEVRKTGCKKIQIV